MSELRTRRLILRPFRESDYDDLYEFLSQLEDDAFEGYPGITYENGREHLKYRVGSKAFFAVELADSGKVIGNIYCGDRDYGAGKSAISSTGITRRRVTPAKPSPRSSGMRSGRGRTGSSRNAPPETPAPGSCWSGWACGARPISGRISFFTGTARALRSGRTPMCTPPSKATACQTTTTMHEPTAVTIPTK